MSKNVIKYSYDLLKSKSKIIEYKDLCENIKHIFSIENSASLNFNKLYKKIVDSSKHLNLYDIGKYNNFMTM